MATIRISPVAFFFNIHIFDLPPPPPFPTRISSMLTFCRYSTHLKNGKVGKKFHPRYDYSIRESANLKTESQPCQNRNGRQPFINTTERTNVRSGDLQVQDEAQVYDGAQSCLIFGLLNQVLRTSLVLLLKGLGCSDHSQSWLLGHQPHFSWLTKERIKSCQGETKF